MTIDQNDTPDQPDYVVDRPQTSTRDYEVLRTQLEAWLQERLPGAKISELTVPSSNGMSSETVLFDVDVPGEVSRNLVARIAPDQAADPVFQHYDMELQFRTMEMVNEHTDVPVPVVHWLETDPSAIGVPFFVMERIEGNCPTRRHAVHLRRQLVLRCDPRTTGTLGAPGHRGSRSPA